MPTAEHRNTHCHRVIPVRCLSDREKVIKFIFDLSLPSLQLGVPILLVSVFNFLKKKYLFSRDLGSQNEYGPQIGFYQNLWMRTVHTRHAESTRSRTKADR